jgi:hypothetical protein
MKGPQCIFVLYVQELQWIALSLVWIHRAGIILDEIEYEVSYS